MLTALNAVIPSSNTLSNAEHIPSNTRAEIAVTSLMWQG